MRTPISSARARKAGFRDLVEHGERSGAGDRVAAERPPEAAGRDGVHDLGTPGHRGERKAAAKGFARHEQVGLDPVALDRPQRAGAADTALHLVVDVEDPVPAAELSESRREVVGHRDEAALPLHGLEDDAGDARRIDLGAEEPLERSERLVRADAAVRIRRGCAIDLGRERAEAAAVDELARHRHGQQRPTVEAVLEHDDGRPAGCGPGDLDGVLDRLRAGVEHAGGGRPFLERRAGDCRAWDFAAAMDRESKLGRRVVPGGQSRGQTRV
jgi:hypothetical protein